MGSLNGAASLGRLAQPALFWAAAAALLAAVFLPYLHLARSGTRFRWARRRGGLAFDTAFWREHVDLRSRHTGWSALPVLLSGLLLAGALAGPQVAVPRPPQDYGKPVMLVVDVSGSMSYKDRGEKQSNLDKAQAIVNDLFSRNTGASFSLLLFGSENYMARYFTANQALFTDTLDRPPDASLESGTEIADALRFARTFVDGRVQAPDKAIILISDLEQDSDANNRMAIEIRRCVAAGIKLYIVAATTDLQATLRDIPPNDQVAGVSIIAIYDLQGRAELARQLAAMRRAPLTENGVTERSLIPWLVAVAIGLVGLGLLLSETRFRKLP